MSHPTAELYRGIVSHKRWLPRPHGFAYELSMMLLDVDKLETSFTGLWPLASATSSWAFASFRPSDHLKGALIPGRSFGACVRDVIASQVPGYRPADTTSILLLTHLRYFGYTFNPISLYYVMGKDGVCECILAEVSNTPWNEMHFYVLHPGAPGVECCAGVEWGVNPSSVTKRPRSRSTVPPLLLSNAACTALTAKGAVAPLDFDAMATLFPEPPSQGKLGGSKLTPRGGKRCGSVSPRGKLSVGKRVRRGTPPPASAAHKKSDLLRFSWAKAFHVSPFFGMDHMCVTFTLPPTYYSAPISN